LQELDEKIHKEFEILNAMVEAVMKKFGGKSSLKESIFFKPEKFVNENNEKLKKTIR